MIIDTIVLIYTEQTRDIGYTALLLAVHTARPYTEDSYVSCVWRHWVACTDEDILEVLSTGEYVAICRHISQ